MRGLLAVVLSCLSLTRLSAAPLGATDAQMNTYLAIWSDNGSVTPDVVRRLYADPADFYGRRMTPDEVYRAKRSLVRLWPTRRYSVVPGTAVQRCSAATGLCDITAIMNWQVANAQQGTGRRGSTTITLTLSRKDGTLKIVREAGIPLARSLCEHSGSTWSCSDYRFPSLPTQ